MRPLALLSATAVAACASGAIAQEQPSTPASPATRADAMSKMAAQEHQRTFHFFQAEGDYTQTGDGEDLFTWDVEGWIGGDINRLWLKTEGESLGGDLEQAEVQALYSRNISTYFDAQAGVRYDFEPDSTAYLVAGLQGLAPYQFETEAFAFLSDRGDVSFRFEQSIDLLLTQRLIAQPSLELNAYAQDVRQRGARSDLAAIGGEQAGIGAGLADIEAAIHLRYEITRKFAPFVEVNYERALGETSQIVRASGGDPEETTLRAGLRLIF